MRLIKRKNGVRVWCGFRGQLTLRVPSAMPDAAAANVSVYISQYITGNHNARQEAARYIKGVCVMYA